jgi:hypothetical protein
MTAMLWLTILGLLALRVFEGRAAKRREDALRRRLEVAETNAIECLCGRK